MRPDLERYHQTDAYLKNELSLEEQQLFESEMEQDASLKSLVESQRLANTLVLQHKLLQMKSKMKTDFQQSVPDTLIRKRNIGLALAGIFLFSMMLIAVYFLWSKKAERSVEIPPAPTPKKSISSNAISSELSSVDLNTQLPIVNKTSEKPSIPDPLQQPIQNENKQEEISTREIGVKQELASNTVVKEEKTTTIESCPDYNLSNSIRITAGCEGKSESTISIKVKTKEAKPVFSLDNKKFINSDYFGNLEAGKYTVFLMDNKGCKDSSQVDVSEVKCQKKREYGFYPDRDEVLTIPEVSENASWNIKNKAGVLVAEGITESTTLEWNGKRQDGGDAAAGLYLLEIKSKNTSELFYITVLK